MTTPLDRTQYPLSPDALERDLFDIGDKLAILEEFTDGVADNHLSSQEHHLIHRQQRLLIVLRDVLKEHLDLIATRPFSREVETPSTVTITATSSNALGSDINTSVVLVDHTSEDTADISDIDTR